MNRIQRINLIGYLFIGLGIILNVFVLGLFSPNGLVTTTKIMIWSFDIGCVILGILIVKYKSKIKGKEILFSLIPVFVLLLLVEGGLRIYYHFNPDPTNEVGKKSDYYGWITKETKQFKTKMKGYAPGLVSISRNGFRLWGDTSASKKKIFFIGDSFTIAVMVTNGECYYDVVKKELDGVEIFAFGCGGFGTLQEYMVLDQFIDSIHPDVIVWQFCSNDLINNDYELESLSYQNNNHNTRPYLINDKIEYKYPSLQLGWLLDILEKSYFLKLVNINLGSILQKYLGFIEDKLTPTHPLIINSKKTTTEIIHKIKYRTKDIPVIAFSADKPAYTGTIFKDICDANDIYFIDTIPDAIARAKKNNIVVDGLPTDGHWNINGHKIVGEILAGAIRAKLDSMPGY